MGFIDSFIKLNESLSKPAFIISWEDDKPEKQDVVWEIESPEPKRLGNKPRGKIIDAQWKQLEHQE